MTEKTPAPRLTSIEIENFRCLKNVILKDLPPLVCLIGENGSGKSTLFEAFRFAYNQKSLILDNGNPNYYSNYDTSLAINTNFYATQELYIKGKATKTSSNFTTVGLNDMRGFFQPSLSKIDVTKLSMSQSEELAHSLSESGDNIAKYAFFFQDRFPNEWAEINRILKIHVPGLASVSAHRDETRQTYLRFRNLSQEIMLLPREMSDGTLLMLAHLLITQNPFSPSILCIDEPEHHLYPLFLPRLAEELTALSERTGNVIVATHSPDLMNRFPLTSFYYFKKNKENFTEIHRLADNKIISTLYHNEGYRVGDMLRDSIISAHYR